MNKICPIALIVLSLAAILSASRNLFPDTKEQTLAYSCGYLAGIQYTLPSKKAEPDHCKSIRLQGVKDGFKAAANP